MTPLELTIGIIAGFALVSLIGSWLVYNFSTDRYVDVPPPERVDNILDNAGLNSDFPYGWYQLTTKTFYVRKRRKYWPSSKGY